jgi:hypothetical protein
MLESITNIIGSATAFLQNGVAPPNTPDDIKRTMEDVNHLSSKKFYIIFSALIMLAFVYFSSIALLCFVVPRLPEVIAAYVTIFTKSIEIFGLIISVYIGAQGIVDLKYQSTSNAGLQGVAETKDVNITEQILTNNAKEDDYTILEETV